MNAKNQINAPRRLLGLSGTGLCAAAMAMALAGCAATPAPPPPAATAPAALPQGLDFSAFRFGDIGIALLAPLSGPQARLGEALVQAAQLALFDAYDPRLKLRVYDTEGAPDGAAQAADQALADGARVILGPLFSASVKAVAAATRQAGVPVLAFSNDPGAAQPGIYVLGLQPAEEVRRVILHAARAKGIAHFAALLPEGDYGAAVLDAMAGAVHAAGAELHGVEIYPRDPQALSPPVQRLAQFERRARWLEEERAFLSSLGDDDLALELLEGLEGRATLVETGYDAVLIAEGGAMLRSLAPLLPIYDVLPQDVQFLGTGLFNDDGLRREPPLHGAWFAAPPEAPFAAFAERFAEHFGRKPPRIAGLAFDAMALVGLLAREPVAADRFAPAAFTDPNGFAGVSGVFRLRPDGLTEHLMAVMRIAPAGIETVDPAPASFEAPVLLGALTQ